MKWLALVLMLIIGLAQGYPLQGGNGVLNCTIYGAFKDPWATGNLDASKYAVLNLDFSLLRADASNSTPIKADYRLTDGNDKVFQNRPEYTRDLQAGRSLIGFVVPKETIAKTLTVIPSADSTGGRQFFIPFSELANSSNGKVTLVYYGVLGSQSASNRKTIEFDVGLHNNGTSKLPLSAGNFSLIDQWGWRYKSKESDRYNGQGFASRSLDPNGTLRSPLVFASLSPLSRPVELVYDYSNASSISIEIDPEAGLQSIAAQPQQQCNECEQAEETPLSSLAGSIKASKARLAKVKGETADSSNPPKGVDEL
jgi:hypothetical protein